MKNLTIREIENLTEKEVKENSEEMITIKSFNCYFVDFDGEFGYSVLIYKNNHHIYFANDYELHHPNKSTKQLKDFYIEELNHKLYTEEELMDTVQTYDEYNAKSRFVRNYWIQQYDHMSIFGSLDEYPKDFRKRMKYKNDWCFCWVEDKDIVDKSKKYLSYLNQEYKRIQKEETTFREMISYELINHECAYTGRFEDALSGLGLRFKDLEEWQKRIVKDELYKQEKAIWDD